jgi:hypothetical protein
MVCIQNDGPKLTLVGRVELLPGVNNVDDDAWRKCFQHKMTQIFLSTGQIRVIVAAEDAAPTKDPVRDAPAPVEEAKPEEPVRMKAAEVVAAVRTSTDVEALHDLLHSDERLTVQAAVNARLDALEKEAHGG